jgi:pyrrolidone-carboxylate peptidase
VLSVEPEAALGKLLPVFEQKPTLVIGFGVHIGVSHLQVNMSAINWLAMRSEADALYFGPIDPALPLEIRVAQPWAQEAIDRIAQTGIAYSTERDAGMHACNLALFHSIAHASASTRVIFFHVGPDILERPELLRDIARVVTALGPP